MEITKDSLLKIRSLITSDKKLDLNFYYNAIDILRNDSLYNNEIKYKKDDGKDPAWVNIKTHTLHFTDKAIPCSENKIKEFELYPAYDDIGIFNYNFTNILLHELSHLKQLDNAKNDEGIIGSLYRKIYEGDRDEEHYRKNPYDYVFEYNADMDAFRISDLLFEDNHFLRTINYMEFVGLIVGHYYDGKTDSFLAERTFKLLNIHDDSIKLVHDLPISTLVHNGLPVSENVLDELYDNPVMNLVKVRKKYNL